MICTNPHYLRNIQKTRLHTSTNSAELILPIKIVWNFSFSNISTNGLYRNVSFSLYIFRSLSMSFRQPAIIGNTQIPWPFIYLGQKFITFELQFIMTNKQYKIEPIFLSEKSLKAGKVNQIKISHSKLLKCHLTNISTCCRNNANYAPKMAP